MKKKTIATSSGLRIRKGITHITWDGCGFAAEIMLKLETWNTVLKEMVLIKRGLIARGVKGADNLKLHMSLWPFIFCSQAIKLDQCLPLIAQAEFEGTRFDGVDIFIDDDHLPWDAGFETIRAFAEQIKSYGFVVGDIVAPAWPFKKGGVSINEEGRPKFLAAFEAACQIAQVLEQLGVRTYGSIRLDSATDIAEYVAGNQKAYFRFMVGTFREACKIARKYGQKIVVEAEVCWGGVHGWRLVLQLFNSLRAYSDVIGFQTDQAHTLHLVAGTNCPATDNLLPGGKKAIGATAEELQAGIEAMAEKLGPHTWSAHVAASNAKLKKINTGKATSGQGEHTETGAHVPADDPENVVEFLPHIIPWITEPDDEAAAA